LQSEGYVVHLNDHIHYDIKIIPKEIVDRSRIDHKCDAITHLLSVSRLLLKNQSFADLLLDHWQGLLDCIPISEKKNTILGCCTQSGGPRQLSGEMGAIARLFTLSEEKTHRYDPGNIHRILGDYQNLMDGVLRMRPSWLNSPNFNVKLAHTLWCLFLISGRRKEVIG
jgi:hypothetical protein